MTLYTVAEVQGMLKIGKSRAYQLVPTRENTPAIEARA
jgi:hypothetical protein